MPRPDMRWRHVVLNTHCSWLPGDPRGFRSFRHKIHSSGDYKNPPPVGEHHGLHEYATKISGSPVIIPHNCRQVVGEVLIHKMRAKDYRLLAVSVGGMHAHLQVELPDEPAKIRRILGLAKTAASHAVRDHLPGKVWGRGGSFDPIDSMDHQQNVFRYILDQEDAWTWSHLQDGDAVEGNGGAQVENEEQE